MSDKKDFLKPSRLVFVNQPLPETPSPDNREIYDGVAETVEESYRQQLFLANELNKKTAPIAKEKEKFESALMEMKEELAKLNFSQSVERDINVFGTNVHIVMDQSGTNQEFVDGQEVNFMQWALSKAEKDKQQQ